MADELDPPRVRDTVSLPPRSDCVQRHFKRGGDNFVPSGAVNDLRVISHAPVMHHASTTVKCLLHQHNDYAPDMGDPSERLRDARVRAGYSSAKAAAEAMGVSVPTYIQHENGGRGISATRAERYAKFFGTTPEWLLYGTLTYDRRVPLGPRLFVVGEVQAGVFNEAWKLSEDEWQVYTGRADVAAPVSKRFGLRVVGDSMDQVYPPGTTLDCVEYDYNEVIPSGKRVIVQRTRVTGTVESTVKELVRDDSGVEWLVPRSTNPNHRAFRGDNPDEPGIAKVEIIGVVVASIRPE